MPGKDVRRLRRTQYGPLAASSPSVCRIIHPASLLAGRKTSHSGQSPFDLVLLGVLGERISFGLVRVLFVPTLVVVNDAVSRDWSRIGSDTGPSREKPPCHPLRAVHKYSTQVLPRELIKRLRFNKGFWLTRA